MFTLEWYLWLLISAIIITTLTILSLKLKWNKQLVTYIMAGVCIVSELVKIFSHMQPVYDEEGYVIMRYALPLHLCSIFIFVIFYLALSKNEERKNVLISFLVPIGIIGSLIALLLATSGVDFKAPYAYQAYIYHACLLWYSLYFVLTKQVDLGKKAYIRNLIILFSLAIVMIWINGALYDDGSYNVNFMFLVRPPADGLPFLNLKHGWYAYFAHLSFSGIVLETLFSLPYILKERKRKENI